MNKFNQLIIMRKVTKVIMIVGVFLIGGLFITLIGEATGHSKGGGPIGIVIMFGIIAAVRAIWKYKPENDNQDITSDKENLDKS